MLNKRTIRGVTLPFGPNEHYSKVFGGGGAMNFPYSQIPHFLHFLAKLCSNEWDSVDLAINHIFPFIINNKRSIQSHTDKTSNSPWKKNFMRDRNQV